MEALKMVCESGGPVAPSLSLPNPERDSGDGVGVAIMYEDLVLGVYGDGGSLCSVGDS